MITTEMIINNLSIPDTNVKIPKAGSSGLHNPIPGKPSLGLQYEAIKKPADRMSVPGSKVNLGGERGVKYCVPAYNSEYKLRPAPIPNANSYQVSTGYARKQAKGLATQDKYPTDNELLVPVSNFNATMKSKIAYPK